MLASILPRSKKHRKARESHDRNSPPPSPASFYSASVGLPRTQNPPPLPAAPSSSRFAWSNSNREQRQRAPSQPQPYDSTSPRLRSPPQPLASYATSPVPANSIYTSSSSPELQLELGFVSESLLDGIAGIFDRRPSATSTISGQTVRPLHPPQPPQSEFVNRDSLSSRPPRAAPLPPPRSRTDPSHSLAPIHIPALAATSSSKGGPVLITQKTPSPSSASPPINSNSGGSNSGNNIKHSGNANGNIINTASQPLQEPSPTSPHPPSPSASSSYESTLSYGSTFSYASAPDLDWGLSPGESYAPGGFGSLPSNGRAGRRRGSTGSVNDMLTLAAGGQIRASRSRGRNSHRLTRQDSATLPFDPFFVSSPSPSGGRRSRRSSLSHRHSRHTSRRSRSRHRTTQQQQQAASGLASAGDLMESRPGSTSGLGVQEAGPGSLAGGSLMMLTANTSTNRPGNAATNTLLTPIEPPMPDGAAEVVRASAAELVRLRGSGVDMARQAGDGEGISGSGGVNVVNPDGRRKGGRHRSRGASDLKPTRDRSRDGRGELRRERSRDGRRRSRNGHRGNGDTAAPAPLPMSPLPSAASQDSYTRMVASTMSPLTSPLFPVSPRPGMENVSRINGRVLAGEDETSLTLSLEEVLEGFGEGVDRLYFAGPGLGPTATTTTTEVSLRGSPPATSSALQSHTSPSRPGRFLTGRPDAQGFITANGESPQAGGAGKWVPLNSGAVSPPPPPVRSPARLLKLSSSPTRSPPQQQSLPLALGPSQQTQPQLTGEYRTPSRQSQQLPQGTHSPPQTLSTFTSPGQQPRGTTASGSPSHPSHSPPRSRAQEPQPQTLPHDAHVANQTPQHSSSAPITGKLSDAGTTTTTATTRTPARSPDASSLSLGSNNGSALWEREPDSATSIPTSQSSLAPFLGSVGKPSGSPTRFMHPPRPSYSPFQADVRKNKSTGDVSQPVTGPGTPGTSSSESAGSTTTAVAAGGVAQARRISTPDGGRSGPRAMLPIGVKTGPPTVLTIERLQPHRQRSGSEPHRTNSLRSRNASDTSVNPNNVSARTGVVDRSEAPAPYHRRLATESLPETPNEFSPLVSPASPPPPASMQPTGSGGRVVVIPGNKITPKVPMIEPVPSPKRRSRPPGPIGPRKPSVRVTAATVAQSSSASTSPPLPAAAATTVAAAASASTPPAPAPAPVPATTTTTATTSGTGSSGNGNSKAHHAPPSPKFQPRLVRWRGLTMDAAKWTLTSNQLQDIVGRAIRQSAEASSIRLLTLEVLDKEVPNEINRLEGLREEIKAKYRATVRRRRVLFRSLLLYAEGSDTQTRTRLSQELQELSVTCDQLAEDLFRVMDELQQLNRLKDVHSASALAMALRKLNSSFLKQVSDMAEKKQQIAQLEAERDEAWATAERIEQELVDLQAKLAVENEASTPNSAVPSSRSSRVEAARKSSVRASKASLRLSRGPHSSISSMSSQQLSVFGLVSAPPVPPMPRLTYSQTLSLNTDLSSASAGSPRSVAMSSVLTGSPGAQNRALVEELYDMLGKPRPDFAYARPGGRTRPVSEVVSPSSLPTSPLPVQMVAGGGAGSGGIVGVGNPQLGSRRRNASFSTHPRPADSMYMDILAEG